MNIETLQKAGVYFDYCRLAVFPQIPYVQDVLYILQLSGEKDAKNYYSPEGAWNWSTYIVNVGLVAAAIGYEVLCMEPRYNEARARKIIAQAILDLTSPEDKCLFNNALAEAAEIVTGQPAPSKSVDREKILASCGCAGCKETIRERNYNEDAYAPLV